MPITGIASYPPTMEEFNLHWVAVNAFDAAQPLVLPGSYAWSNFNADQNAVLSAITAVTQAATNARLASAQLEISKRELRERVPRFRKTVQLNYAGTSYLRDVPQTPAAGAIETKFMEPLDDMEQLWERINAAAGDSGPGIVLPGNYTAADFGVNILGMRSTFQLAQSEDTELGFKRHDRDALLGPIYDRMLQYRTAVELHLPAGNPLLMSVPRLSPIPGTTPPGLVVTGEWNSTINKAYLSWPQSTFANIDKIQVRGCTGSTYKAADEEVVADLPPTATSYETDWGLTAPGALAVYKFYVMATTGNENGGKAVRIVRPTT